MDKGELGEKKRTETRCCASPKTERNAPLRIPKNQP